MSQAAATDRRGATKQANRQALVDATLSLVSTQGWAATSLNEIARSAGLTTGAIYSIFGSGPQLLLAAVETYRVMLHRQIEEIDAATLADRLRDLARLFHASAIADPNGHLAAANVELLRLSSLDPRLRAEVAIVTERDLDDLATHLARWSEATGEPFPSPPDTAAVLLLGALQGVARIAAKLARPLPVELFEQAAVSVLCRP